MELNYHPILLYSYIVNSLLVQSTDHYHTVGGKMKRFTRVIEIGWLAPCQGLKLHTSKNNLKYMNIHVDVCKEGLLQCMLTSTVLLKLLHGNSQNSNSSEQQFHLNHHLSVPSSRKRSLKCEILQSSLIFREASVHGLYLPRTSWEGINLFAYCPHLAWL